MRQMALRDGGAGTADTAEGNAAGRRAMEGKVADGALARAARDGAGGGVAGGAFAQTALHAGNPAVDGADIAARVGALDWAAIEESLNAEGYAVARGLLAAQECRALAAGYADAAQFRSRVVMARHGFGRGEYQYFAYPLPDLVARLREALYLPLARIANHWNAALGEAARFPGQHAKYLAQCHAAGQVRPTPLLLQYGAGDYNCLHQDLYGEHVFPLQAAFLLSRPGEDFGGGEFVLTEQRPRMQSRAAVVPLGLGDAVIFPVRHRPVQGTRGVYRVNMRHGVSRLVPGSKGPGQRHTLGVIFHDAA
ncbi:MAG: proline hydroxylase [Betaproteobacteria bacterium]|nr:proline hydroxylase [Betaproteobacteria bacterium]